MATVKLLLKESIKNVGRVGDVVEVSPGYARNYLLPARPGRRADAEQRQEDRGAPQGDREAGARAPRAAGRAASSSSKASRSRSSAAPTSRATCSAPSPRPTSPRRCRRRASTSSPTTSTCPASSIASTSTRCTIKFAEDLATEIKVWVAPDADSKAAIDAAAKAEADADEPAHADARRVVQRLICCANRCEHVRAIGTDRRAGLCFAIRTPVRSRRQVRISACEAVASSINRLRSTVRLPIRSHAVTG